MSKIALFGLAEWEQEYYQRQGFFIDAIFVAGVLNNNDLSNLSAEITATEIISIFVDSTITAEVLAALPNLKHIATRSTGYDHIDLQACREKGISVSTVPGYGEITVAEYAFALLLTLSGRVYEGFDRIRETGQFSPEGLKGFDLCGKTFGIIGAGRIGKHAAQIAKGFGMKVVAYDLHPNEAAAQVIGFTYVSLEELLQ